MPKYFDFMVCGHYLYYTTHCIVEAMHVHASDKNLTPEIAAKFFVKSDGDTKIAQIFFCYSEAILSIMY